MLRKMRRVFERLAADGVSTTLRYARHMLSERCNDRVLGIQTTREVRSKELGFLDRERKGYEPTAYRDFRAMMKWVRVTPDQDVFLDYGSGMGRILALAATYAFRRVIGVEISPLLVDASRRNLEQATHRLRCRNIEIVMADAGAYPLPDDVTVIHLFNPFEGDLLVRVLRNIRDSLERCPRELTMLYTNPIHLEPMLQTLDWLVPVARERRPAVAVPKGNPSDFYAVYRTRPVSRRGMFGGGDEAPPPT